MDPVVRKATQADNDAIATTLASAFYDDPLYSWFFPDASTRLRKLKGLFAYGSPRMALPYEATWITEEGTAVAVWHPPEAWPMRTIDQLRVIPGFARWAGRYTARLLRVMTAMDKAHPRDPPSWYLFMLGTAAGYRGRGLGSAVITPVLEQCDATGIPAYLETANLRNLPFYARHGFVELDPIEIGNAPTLMPMWREPR
jgi:GNAT superfamily N-acetyltransferase